MDLLAVLALAALAAGLGLLVKSRRRPPAPERAAESYPAYTLDQFREKLGEAGVVAVDARGAEAYALGHIPGAVSVPAFTEGDEIDRRLAPRMKAGGETLLIIYCEGAWCRMGELLERKLIERGYRRVAAFPPGWEAWESKGLPEEKGG